MHLNSFEASPEDHPMRFKKLRVVVQREVHRGILVLVSNAVAQDMSIMLRSTTI